jgi:hypothetical protein
MTVLTLKGAIDPRLHDLARTKAYNPAGLDFRRFARLGVSSHPGTLGADLKNAKARQLDLLIKLKSLGHEVECPLNKFSAILSCQSHFLVDSLTQLRTR